MNTQNTPLQERDLLKKLKRVCQKAGIKTETRDEKGKLRSHVDLHSLRVTFATHLIAKGVNLKTVQDYLGHSTLTMMLKYAKLAGMQENKDSILSLPVRELPGAEIDSRAKCRPNVAKHRKGKRHSPQALAAQ